MQPRLVIRQNPRLIGALCVFLGLLGWAFYLIAFYREPSQDWMVFYTAARAYWENNLGLIFDGDRLTAVINDRFSPWLSWPLPLHPWLYPPHFLLYLLPFGLMPPALSCALFLLVGLTQTVIATWTIAQNARERWVHGASLVLCPAAAITICLGQNAFLTSALLVGGFGLVGRRPLLGGTLLGALSYKPQFWLLVPVALIAAGEWLTLLSAVTTASLLVLASLLIFGSGPWHAWLDLMTGPSALYESWITAGRMNGQSVYTCAVLIGASKTLANLVQGLASLLAASCVFWIFRRPAALSAQLSVLLAATMLAAPHIIGYDAVMLAIAATMLFCHVFEERLRFSETIIIVLAWVSPLANPPSLFWPGLFTPLVISLFIGCVLLRTMRCTSTGHRGEPEA
jgi:alpha-1,2-mannosyltransferase